VLSIISDEGLQANAAHVGAHAMRELSHLLSHHEMIGDIRGEGLMIGVELIRNGSSREPDADAAKHAMGFMRMNGVLVSTDGPHNNVLKMKPPMCVTTADMDQMVDVLDQALRDFSARASKPATSLAATPVTHATTAAVHAPAATTAMTATANKAAIPATAAANSLVGNADALLAKLQQLQGTLAQVESELGALLSTSSSDGNDGAMSALPPCRVCASRSSLPHSSSMPPCRICAARAAP